MATDVMRVRLSSPTAPQAGPVLSQMTISIGAVTPVSVTVNYECLPGNQPHSYSNFLAIWQSTVIPWSVPPLKRQAIPSDGQSGSTTLTGLAVQEKPYIVGYGVGTELTSISTSVGVFVGGQGGSSTSTSLGLASIQPDTLVVHYQVLPGYLPKTSNNWIGLWVGQASPYYSGDPIATGSPDQDVSDGYIVLNGLTLTFGTTYTLVYFTGPAKTEASAILTFTTTS